MEVGVHPDILNAIPSIRQKVVSLIFSKAFRRPPSPSLRFGLLWKNTFSVFRLCLFEKFNQLETIFVWYTRHLRTYAPVYWHILTYFCIKISHNYVDELFSAKKQSSRVL